MYQQTWNKGRFVNGFRALLTGLTAVMLIGLVLVLAAFLTMAALVVAVVAALGAVAWWVYCKIRGRGRRCAEDTVLVARRGPHGWTVDDEDQSNGV